MNQLQVDLCDIEYDLKSAHLLLNNDKSNHKRSPRIKFNTTATTSNEHPAIVHAAELITKYNHLTKHLQPAVEKEYLEVVQRERNLSKQLNNLTLKFNILKKNNIYQKYESSDEKLVTELQSTTTRDDSIRQEIIEMLINDDIALKRWHKAKIEYDKVRRHWMRGLVRSKVINAARPILATTTTSTSVLHQWFQHFEAIANQSKKNSGFIESLPCFQCSIYNNVRSCNDEDTPSATLLQFKTRLGYKTATVLLKEVNKGNVIDGCTNIHITSIQPLSVVKPNITFPIDVSKYMLNSLPVNESTSDSRARIVSNFVSDCIWNIMKDEENQTRNAILNEYYQMIEIEKINIIQSILMECIAHVENTYTHECATDKKIM
jgi:hypothetical protein